MQINSTNTRYSSFTFKGLPENVNSGKQLLREFRKEYGRPLSYSWLLLIKQKRMANHQSIPESLTKLLALSAEKINKVRGNGTFIRQNFESKDDFIKQVDLRVKEHNAANCDENCDLAENLAQKLNIPTKEIALSVLSKIGRKCKIEEHCLLLGYANKSAILSNPDTWGKNAVVIDPWCSIVMPKNKAIEFYKKFFKAYDDSSMQFNSYQTQIVNNKFRKV